MNRTDIPCDELNRLYLDDQYSASEIARQYGCSVATIYTRLAECGITVRSASEAAKIDRGIDLPCSELQSLYVEQKQGIYQIAALYHCSPVTIHKHLKKCGIEARPRGGAPIEYEKKDFVGSPADKAYLVGFRHGDLHVERGNWAIRVRCTSTKQDQLDLIRSLFCDYGGIWVSKPRFRRGTCITAHLNLSFEFLVPLNDQIPDWILENDALFLSFLGGYLDAEGSFLISGKRAYFKVDSCDNGILSQAWQKLQSMGLEFSPPYIVRKKGAFAGLLVSRCDLWRLTTERKATFQFCELVGPILKHPKRRMDMLQVKANVESRNSR